MAIGGGEQAPRVDQIPTKEAETARVIDRLRTILRAEFGEVLNSNIITLEASTWMSPVFGVAEAANVEYDGELYCATLDNGREVVVMQRRAPVPFGVMPGSVDMRPMETWLYHKDPNEPTICRKLSQEITEQTVPHKQAPDLSGLIKHLKSKSILGIPSSIEFYENVEITSQ